MARRIVSWRRIALAAFIVGIHAALVIFATMSRPQTQRPAETTLTWVPLTQDAPRQPAAVPHVVKELPLPPSLRLSIEVIPMPAIPSGPALEPGIATQQPTLPSGGHENFLAQPLPNRPTEEEAKLNAQFARDKAVEDAPILLPCFPFPMGTLRCLAGNFDVGTYAGTPHAERKPIVPNDGSLARRAQPR